MAWGRDVEQMTHTAPGPSLLTDEALVLTAEEATAVAEAVNLAVGILDEAATNPNLGPHLERRAAELAMALAILRGAKVRTFARSVGVEWPLSSAAVS